MSAGSSERRIDQGKAEEEEALGLSPSLGAIPWPAPIPASLVPLAPQRQALSWDLKPPRPTKPLLEGLPTSYLLHA